MYVQIAIYTSKLQHTCPQFTKYMSKSLCGVLFILPRFGVIFDIYCGYSFDIYISVQTYANELTCVP